MNVIARTLVLVGAAGAAAAAWAQESVVDSRHNLSVFGPGAIRATAEDDVCIFCHAAHKAAPIRPLWNREMPLNAYTPYTSNALDARPGQPTGSSKMCLSCHDGTIALGSVVSRDQIIQMAAGITTLPPGSSNLGTDLSDDHPISFVYDAALAQRDRRLLAPEQLPTALRLSVNGELQCTTCHDAHDDTFGHFLVMSNEQSSLCQSCHQISTTTVLPHTDCRSCHQSHTAPSGPYLLTDDRITNTCLTCHDGSDLDAPNIQPDLMKISVHDTDSPVDPPEPIPGHVTCADCHDPHSMDRGAGTAPSIHPNFGAVSGVTASGGVTEAASHEFEVCYKCHADRNVFNASWVSRQITQINTRLEFAFEAVSSHPVQVAGRNPDVPSLKPPWTTGSIMYCSDCHGSDSGRRAGGSGPDGVHGSNWEPLLLARYDTDDFTSESASAYALCYMCHYRDGPDGIFSDRTFLHTLHVREERTPCSACHDAHGISSAQGSSTNNAHLINFATEIVFPEPGSGIMRYESTGTFTGSCTLRCHGETHSGFVYPERDE